MLPPLGTALFVGVVTGIGGVVTYTAFKAANIGKEEGMMAQEKLKPPRLLQNLEKNQTVNDLLPMPPDQGPPLPRKLGLKWPWLQK